MTYDPIELLGASAGLFVVGVIGGTYIYFNI